MTPCPFCNPTRPLLGSNSVAVVFEDAFPVSRGHLLVVPRRHVLSCLDLEPSEFSQCFDLVREACGSILNVHSPDGLNIGLNCGIAAGQTIMHAHIHIIPRYIGDVEDPSGGVRGVIPDWQRY